MPLNHVSQYSDLTDQQYCAIGKILVESSNIEYLIECFLIRLCRAPYFLGLTLTNQINPVRRLESLKILIDVHRRRYQCKFIKPETLDRIDDLIKEIDSSRIDRNKFAHYCWCRSDDNRIFGIRFTGKQPSSLKPNKDSIIFSIDELNQMIKRLREIVKELESLLTHIEEIPEMDG